MTPTFVTLARASSCLVAVALLTDCRPFSHRHVAGAVLSVSGLAEVEMDGRKGDLAADSWIHPGEKIISTSNSRVDLLLLPGMLVELQGPGELQIISLRLTRDGNETIQPMISRRAIVRLDRGSLVVSIGRAQTRSQLSIETDAGVFSAGSSRTFELSAQSAKVRAICVRGKLNFRSPNGQRTTLGPGYFAEYPEEASASHKVSAAGPSAQAQVRRLLELERHLQQMEEQKQYLFTPWDAARRN